MTARVRSKNGKQIQEFLDKYEPDVMFLSEVRMAAANNARGKKGPHTKFHRGRMHDDGKKAAEDANGVRALLRTKEFAAYKTYFSLADSKYAGTAVMLRIERLKEPKSVRFNIDPDGDEHDKEGRVNLVEFDEFSVLHTYVPNNGWGESHFERRRIWDEKIKGFMEKMQKPVMWVGDLNVAPEDIDLSHATDYRNASKPEKSVKVDPKNKGQPGCTDAERERFMAILHAGSLVDVYRSLYPTKKDYTWRGNISGMHGGRGMRIDHCIASKKLAESISDVQIIGYGAERKGFMGSDHSPLLIKVEDLQKEGEPDKVVEQDKS